MQQVFQTQTATSGGEGEVFNTYRPLLFSIAYRMLGSVMDAEDVVQEAFLRWRQQNPATVASPKSYLTTVVTHLSIDSLRSARVRREEYIGQWLPEPLVTDERVIDADPVALAESLSMAFLMLLERLTPIERAVFLLHDVLSIPSMTSRGWSGKAARIAARSPSVPADIWVRSAHGSSPIRKSRNA